ncbi:MAG: ATP-grasp domain-containing protein, partial [Baekduia sp.]
LGCEPLVVQAGPSLAGDLQAAGPQAAIMAVLDERLADGAVQDVCAELEIACVGATAPALRACADRVVAAERLAGHGVPVPDQRLFTRAAIHAVGLGAVLPRTAQALGADVMIKPRFGTGGLGVKRVRGGDLAGAVLNTFNYGDAVVVERVVPGRELTVLMTGAVDEPMAVGVAQVRYKSEDSLAAAWAREFQPADDVDRSSLGVAVNAARGAAWALGLSGLSTVDVIVDDDGKAWVIDVDGMLDWRSTGVLSACLAHGDCTAPQLVASLLRDVGAAMRLAA